MSTLGTFDSFTTMRLGIYAAQQGLRVTGNNISNINTPGYTRQRADQVSFKTGGSDRYASMIDKKMGNGVLVSGINQIRDPFLDIRYRNASTDTYHLDTWLAGMQDIATILDEVGKGENDGDGLIYAQLQDLADKLRAYSANPTIENDRLVRNSASSLTTLFHNSADRLDQLYANTQTHFNNNITAVNEILYNIRDLDKSIRESEIHGDMALELRDERNLQIDKLSQYLDIKVEYSYEDVGSGVQVEKLTIKLNNANPDKDVTTDESILVDGLYATQLSVPDEKPLANTFDTAEYAYLKGYSYLTGLSQTEAQEFLQSDEAKALGLTNLTQFATGTNEKGEKVYYIGTNFVDDADKVKNDNYTIQLGKLLNSKGDAWEKNTTTWVDVTGTEGAPVWAQYKYTVTVDDFTLPTKFTIYDGEGKPVDYTVVEGTAAGKNEVSINTVKNTTAFASFLAKELTKLGREPDYNITSEGNQIVFTAKNPGKVSVDEGAPSVAPDLEVQPSNSWAHATLSSETEGRPPVDAGTTEDEYGTKTTIGYSLVDGRVYRVKIETEYTRDIALDDNDTRGILQAQRELLTEEGEFASLTDVGIDENALTKRGIPYYQKSLDLLAQRIAEEYNKLNQGYAYNQDGYYIDKEGNPLMLEDTSGVKDYVRVDGLTPGQQAYLTNNGYTLDSWLEGRGYSMGGALFSNGSNGTDTTGSAINAHNIDISYGWSNGKWNLIPTFKMLFTDEGGLVHSTQNDNADHMLAMLDKALTYNPRDLAGSDAIGPELFTGSFNDMLSHMMAVEAEDERTTTVKLNTSASVLEDLDYRREGVSGVDLNDEAMNMVQYQKAMNAAMRLMTAIDEALERLINNTGIAGR